MLYLDKQSFISFICFIGILQSLHYCLGKSNLSFGFSQRHTPPSHFWHTSRIWSSDAFSKQYKVPIFTWRIFKLYNYFSYNTLHVPIENENSQLQISDATFARNTLLEVYLHAVYLAVVPEHDFLVFIFRCQNPINVPVDGPRLCWPYYILFQSWPIFSRYFRKFQSIVPALLW